MSAIFTAFNTLESQMAEQQNLLTGTLRLSTASDYGVLIIDILKRSQGDYPDVKLDINTTNNIVPLAAGAAHVALRAGINLTNLI